VLNALRAHDVDAARLMIEISESTLTGDAESGRAELSQLRRAGVGIAIDNFGTGQSSIAQLSQFPADLLKIDREFLEPVPGAGEREVIIGLIIGAAHAMKMRVVAAGVEYEDQMIMLRDLGCEIAQGHLIARPMPVARVSAWTDEWNGVERPAPDALAAELLSAMAHEGDPSNSASN
jgi:EAL domain-containing protein (putative c-di-GMP-specific phosphodiesterase class I)